jgi:hypothetical protein
MVSSLVSFMARLVTRALGQASFCSRRKATLIRQLQPETKHGHGRGHSVEGISRQPSNCAPMIDVTSRRRFCIEVLLELNYTLIRSVQYSAVLVTKAFRRIVGHERR